MNGLLLNHALGVITYQDLRQAVCSRLLHAIQPSNVVFEGLAPSQNDSSPGASAGTTKKPLSPHSDDSSIAIWDLEDGRRESGANHILHFPLDYAKRTSKGQSFGITCLSFYPFDSLAFLSSSYDHTLKIYDSTTLQPSASFDLDTIVYSHDLSPIATHLLVACATQHPAIRLVDLRSGVSTHSLTGHTAAVLAVSWSPLQDNILASGSIDGTVRLWDVRRSGSQLGLLDLEDSVGGGARNWSRSRFAKAHAGPVNGLLWSEDGRHLVSAGQDERIRVWDAATGANTLVNFGPLVRNAHLSALFPAVAPADMVASGRELLFYPNEQEILVFELFEGRLLKRLRVLGGAAGGAGPVGSLASVKMRTTALAWRHHHVELYSAHGDGTIRAWLPRTSEEAYVEEAEEAEEKETAKRKAEVLDDIFQQLAKRQITFG